jgi:enoyl-CoA hydratase
MDAVFHMHHLAHAHSQLVTGDLIGGLTHKDIAKASKG